MFISDRVCFPVNIEDKHGIHEALNKIKAQDKPTIERCFARERINSMLKLLWDQH